MVELYETLGALFSKMGNFKDAYHYISMANTLMRNN
jgi:hypothetical protein